MDQQFFIFSIILSYLLGSIPSAVWVGKSMFGIDVREHGSGNAGASNAMRVLGKRAGIIVLFLDFLKGLASSSFMFLQTQIEHGTPSFRHYQLILGLVAVFGHVFPIFAKFKGGKGIATLLGMTVGISWPVSLFCAIVFVLVVWMTKYISLGSMIGTALSPLFVRLIYGSGETFFMYFCCGFAIMVIYLHRKNIKRLRAGNESKFSFSQEPVIAKDF